MAPLSGTHSLLLTFTSQVRLSFLQSDSSIKLLSQTHSPVDPRLIFIKVT